MDTQTQIDRLIELAIVQRSELKQLVSELPQLREYLGAEIERTFEEAEPQIRTELEEFCRARATDEHAKTGAALAAKVEELSKQLEVTTAAKYSVLMAERAENVNLLAKAEARIEDAASMLSHAVKEIVTDELSRFPRAGEIDQLRKEFAEPRGLHPRGRWMPDETYQRLDLVTINGDSFVSNIDGNRERPSRTAGDWTLSAARGNGGGGGGVTTMTDLVPVPTDGQLLIGNGAAFVNSTLTAGTGISISNGAGSITINATDGNITLDDGTAAAPSLNFTNEPTTGLFRASANVMGFAVNGVSRATMTTTGVTVTGTITPSGSVHAAAGSVGNPSLAFNSDQDTGLFSIGANNIGVAAGGAKVLDIATTGLGVTGTLSVSGVATLGAGAILNTPASGTLTNATGLPISTGVSGLGANVAAFLATPSSANLAAALTDETGTGANVFATSPTLTTPISATLTSPASTNLTLAGGAGNSSIILTPAGTGGVGIGTTSPAEKLHLYDGTTDSKPNIFLDSNYAGVANFNNRGGVLFGVGGTVVAAIKERQFSDGIYALNFEVYNGLVGSPALASRMTLTGNGNLLIGGTTDISGTGGLKIFGTTAGSSGAGALVVAGGISAAGASYFTSGVTVIAGSSNGFGIGRLSNATTYGAISFTPPDFSSLTMQGMYAGGGASTYITGTTSTILQAAGVSILTAASAGVSVTGTLSSTQAATFAGAVTIAGTVIHTLSATPASASATGTVGTMSWDASYIYICTAANTWKRVAIATW